MSNVFVGILGGGGGGAKIIKYCVVYLLVFVFFRF